MECPECQLEVPDDFNFCKWCGHHFAETPVTREASAETGSEALSGCG